MTERTTPNAQQTDLTVNATRNQTLEEPQHVAQTQGTSSEGRFKLMKINTAYCRITIMEHPTRMPHIMAQNPSPQCRLELTGDITRQNLSIEHLKRETQKHPSAEILRDPHHSGLGPGGHLSPA